MARRTLVGFLLAIVAATCLVQAVAISRAAVPALDAVRFVNSARSIDQLGLLGFLRAHTEPPLFSITVWGAHGILVALMGEFRESWALSVHLAAALPLIVLPIPVFWLARRFVGPYAALFGTILVLSLPELVRLGADGISDSTHLLLLAVATALLAAHLQASDRTQIPGVPALLVAGIATALALLARTEAVLLAAAFGVVLLIRGLRSREVPWRSALPYAAGLAAVLAPYGLLLALAPSESIRMAVPSGSSRAASWEADFDLPDGESLSFAPKDPTTSIRRRGLAAAAIQLAVELPKAFGYVPGMLALVGFWILRSRPTTDADRLLQAFCVLLLAAIVFHTSREGYLAARHMLPLAVAATACMGFGAQAVGGQIQSAFSRIELKHNSVVSHAAVVLTLVVAFLSVLYGVRPLHTSRTGHRSAATWLARNARREDRVVDTQGWTGLYSGLATVPYDKSRAELSQPGLRYLVIEDRELSYDSRRSRTIQHLLEQAGTPVAAFPTSPTAGPSSASVLVYEWNLEDR
jgi:uncharacterized membrane protein (UPF0136 family)